MKVVKMPHALYWEYLEVIWQTCRNDFPTQHLSNLIWQVTFCYNKWNNQWRFGINDTKPGVIRCHVYFILKTDANQVDVSVTEWVTSVQMCRMIKEISIEWSVPPTKLSKKFVRFEIQYTSLIDYFNLI